MPHFSSNAAVLQANLKNAQTNYFNQVTPHSHNLLVNL